MFKKGDWVKLKIKDDIGKERFTPEFFDILNTYPDVEILSYGVDYFDVKITGQVYSLRTNYYHFELIDYSLPEDLFKI